MPPRRTLLLLLAALAPAWAGCAPAPPSAPSAPVAERTVERAYYPGPGDGWERRSPAEAGMDPRLLDEAVEFARENETPWPTDLRAALQESLARGPHGEIVGPVRDRGEPNGLIVRDGYIVAEWGPTERVDMTFSISKSYLATLAGLALDAGLIRDVHNPVRAYVPDTLFAGRNAPITWDHLLRQTSEWEGTLWDKPDVADRREGRDRTLNAPGTFWEYNDVRVNLTALALLHVWDRPLPEVLEERIMDPIGASPTWQWHGYRNSYLELDGERVQSVSGGGHWGGGVWISARDHARFGLLHLRNGRWEDRQLLSAEWIRRATTPGELKPTYGYLWWLNTDRELFPSAPASSYFALGAGTNLIWIDPEHDLVAVVRWIDNGQTDEFIRRVMASLEAGAVGRPAAPDGRASLQRVPAANPYAPTLFHPIVSASGHPLLRCKSRCGKGISISPSRKALSMAKRRSLAVCGWSSGSGSQTSRAKSSDDSPKLVNHTRGGGFSSTLEFSRATRSSMSRTWSVSDP